MQTKVTDLFITLICITTIGNYVIKTHHIILSFTYNENKRHTNHI